MTVSIIIPTLNRANTLALTLSSIYALPSLESVEVIVVDNGSTDNTAAVCSVYTSEQPALNYIYDAEPGLLTGRHLGASRATGEVLCFLDDDVKLSASWLSGVRDAFHDSSVQLATGPCLPEYEVTPPLWLKYFWQKAPAKGKICTWLSLMDLGPNIKTVHPNTVWGLNFCIRKKALLELGGFHPDCIPPHLQMFQGDGETGLTMKAHLLQYKSLYHPDIKLSHLVPAHRLTMDYFRKRAFYQGVCNSFTDLRNVYSGTYSSPVFKQDPGGLLKLRQHLRTFKNSITQRHIPKDVKTLYSLVTAEEKQGYDFHQSAFANNNVVKEWVLKKDYWNYKLPV